MISKNAILTGTFLYFISAASWALVQAQISQQGDTVHLELTGQSQWNYDIQKVEKKGRTFVEMNLPALDAASLQQIQGFKNPLFSNVEVNPNGPDGNVVLTVQLTHSSVEPFDYLTEKPSRLIVDFFKNSNPDTEKAAPKKEAKVLKPKAPKAEVSEARPVKEALPEKQRAPASTDVLVVNDQGQQVSLEQALSDKPTANKGMFDGADPGFERFAIKDYEIKEESIIAAQGKIYIDFPMLRVPSPYLEILQTRTPSYEIVPQDTEENKQARLLLTLFQNKRYNVFQQTVQWFLRDYPNSQYDEIVRFMWADSLFALWTETRKAEDFDVAMLRYRQALEKYPQSPLLERTFMLMGFATLDRGDYLGTLRLFQTHLQKRPQSPNKDIARFAIADAYLKINRYDEANQIYNEIEKDAILEKDRIQAAFLRGDVAYQKKDFRTAIQEYQNAAKKYPKAESEFPNSIYNQASAYFGLKDYKKSLDLYREFLKKFSNHKEAAYAMTRVGELLDILGADKAKVLGAYLETYFRFGDSPRAVVARLRMVSERMHSMKPKEVEKAVKDIQELSKDSELPKMAQFATVMIADGFTSRKDYGKAIDLLVRFYQENPTSSESKLISNRIVENLNRNLIDLVDQGEFINALKLHDKYAESWLKTSNRIDTRYNVGRAFEQSGVFKQAQKLYQETLNQIYSLKGTVAGRERSVLEKIPSEDEVNLRLAHTQSQMSQFAAAYDSLKNIKNPEKLSQRDQVERVQLAADLLDKKGETEAAVRYLVELLKEWSGVPELVAEPYLKLAQLEMKLKRPEDAIQSLRKIGTLMDDSQKVATSTHARSLELLGELEIQRGNKAEGLKAYENLLKNYEKSRPLASYRYKVGQMYFEKGEIKKASEVWNELKNEKNNFWYKMAQEQLKGSEWKDEYDKYIKRIPAMNNDSQQPATERK